MINYQKKIMKYNQCKFRGAQGAFFKTAKNNIVKFSKICAKCVILSTDYYPRAMTNDN